MSDGAYRASRDVVTMFGPYEYTCMQNIRHRGLGPLIARLATSEIGIGGAAYTIRPLLIEHSYILWHPQKSSRGALPCGLSYHPM